MTKTFEVTVKIVMSFPEEHAHHEDFGVEATAKRYAEMSQMYKSIGAEKYEVVKIEEIKTTK